MTRSGLAAATLAANDANGHRAGMLQSWNLPRSSSSSSALADCFAAFRRQPVSPNAATDVSVGLTAGSGKFSMLADLVPAASGNSHTSTGNAASGRGANIHRLLGAVDGDRRTPRGVRDDGPRARALRTEHDIGGLELYRLRMSRDRRQRTDERKRTRYAAKGWSIRSSNHVSRMLCGVSASKTRVNALKGDAALRSG